jgi:hypothetical protein
MDQRGIAAMDLGHAAFRHGPPVGRDLDVELVPPAALRGEMGAWRALAARAAEPSALNDPEVTLAALQHLPGGRDAMLAVVRGGEGLAAVVPLRRSRAVLSGGELQSWAPDPLPSLPPLVAAERTAEALEALVDGLATGGRRMARLTLTGLAADGPIARALAGIAARSGRRLASAERPGQARSTPDQALRLRRKDLQRALSRLSPRFEQARGPREVRDGVEILLALDASGATRQRPALIADPGAASFLRTASRGLAAARRARVEVLRFGDRPVAAALVVAGDGPTAVWRFAADPAVPEATELLAVEIALGSGRGEVVDLGQSAPLPGATPVALADLSMELRPRPAAFRFGSLPRAALAWAET